jgi:hypothetical protein
MAFIESLLEYFRVLLVPVVAPGDLKTIPLFEEVVSLLLLLVQPKTQLLQIRLQFLQVAPFLLLHVHHLVL